VAKGAQVGIALVSSGSPQKIGGHVPLQATITI
jgi:hypothetical protein